MRFLALAACVLLAAPSAFGDPLAGSSLPAGTRWVMHVDVDAARLATPIWNIARSRFLEPRRAEILPRLAAVERITGMKLPGELHDVTLYGNSFDASQVCLRIHGVMDKANITHFLRDDPAFTQTGHAGHDVITWRDQGHNRLMYAGFEAQKSTVPVNSWVILSPNPKALELALDAMDAKQTLAADSPLAPPSGIAAGLPGAPPTPLFWLAAKGLSDLPRIQRIESPLLTQMDAASLALRWSNNRATADLRVQAASEEAAHQFQAVAEGVKAFVALSAADGQALPRMRLLAAALQQLNVHADGKLVTGEWSMEAGKMELLMSLARQEQAAGAKSPAPAVDSRP